MGVTPVGFFTATPALAGGARESAKKTKKYFKKIFFQFLENLRALRLFAVRLTFL